MFISFLFALSLKICICLSMGASMLCGMMRAVTRLAGLLYGVSSLSIRLVGQF